MKKFVSILLATMMLASCAVSLPSCREPDDTTLPDVTDAPETEAPDTNAPETDAPETDAPETDAPETDGGTEIPDDPTFDADAEGKPNNMIYEYDFSGEVKNIEGFSLSYVDAELTAGKGVTVSGNNGIVKIDDKNINLKGKSIMVEADITFDELPHKAEGVTNFPLSILSWIRTTESGPSYEWAFKLDDQGYIYVKNTTTPTNTKVETGKRYTFGVYYNENDGTLQVFLDGVAVASKSFSPKELVGSTIRIYDAGKEKAHFKATLHATRAYHFENKDLLTDATRDVFTAIDSYTTAPDICFVAYTDKDALSYKVGEEMTFDIYLVCNGEVVSAPYFYYSVKGEDGQTKTEGYADGSKGHFTVKAKMSKPGAVRVEALACDENKVKLTKSNSKLYVNLETSTPQTANVAFKGGAIAGLEEITMGGKIPTDLEAYWDKVVADCYKGDIKLLRFEEIDPASHGGSASKHSLYIVEIECEGGFATGYLSVPKNKSELKLRVGFVSYGNAKKPQPAFYDSHAYFSICAHSYKVDDPKAAVEEKYGFDTTENQNPDTVYFKEMFIRNITATRFLKAYIGDGSYGKITLDGKTIAPLNKWKVGDEYIVSGGSQASFQSVAIAAMDKDVTSASFGVPWFCDIGGDLVGRFSGWNPDYTDALMYYDSCSLATLIEDDVEVTITAGLGDTTSEPSGVVALYNALNCKVTMSMYQNREHTYNPPMPVIYRVSKDK